VDFAKFAEFEMPGVALVRTTTDASSVMRRRASIERCPPEMSIF